MIPRWISNAQGVFLNQSAVYVLETFLVPQVGQVPLILAAAPSATVPTVSPPIILEAGQDGPRELFYQTGETDPAVLAAVNARMRVSITDTAWRRVLMNREIPVIHVFSTVTGGAAGAAGVPSQAAFLEESIFLEEQQTLALQFSNNSIAGPTNFRFQFSGRRFQAAALTRKDVTAEIQEMRHKKLFRSPYWFTSDQAITIPAGGTVDVFFTTFKSTMLVLTKAISSFISAGVAGDIVNGFACEFFDFKTERPLQNQPIPSSCCSGTAQFPHVLAAPFIVEENTKMRVRMTNLITDAPTEVFFTWVGVSFYTAANPLQAQAGVAQETPMSVGAP